MTLLLKRIYDAPEPRDGTRILVDRLWPRGVARATARIDHWMPAAAPSPALRTWYGHAVPKWEEFKRRYFLELDAAPDAIRELLDLAAQGTVTLLFAARDTAHSNAAALKEYLEDGARHA